MDQKRETLPHAESHRLALHRVTCMPYATIRSSARAVASAVQRHGSLPAASDPS
jgi:hypothetical protein